MNPLSKLPVPGYMAESIYELSPAFFTEKGIRLLLLDLDNTLAPYESDTADPQLQNWLTQMRQADIEPFIFSNNRGGRPAHFAQLLDIGFIGRAKKPNPRRLWATLETKGIRRDQTALVGDQIYTDIFCAKRAGILAVSVRPIRMRNPLRALRYAAEAPFRLVGCLTGRKVVRHDKH